MPHDAGLLANLLSREVAAGTTDDIRGGGEARLYAVIDAGLVEMLAVYLEGFGAEHVCLFSGKALDDLGEVAPYLVACPENSDVLDWILDEVVPKEACIFLVSTDGLNGLKLHLKKFLQIRGPDGGLWYFKFYLPKSFAAHCRRFDRAARAAFFARVETAICFHAAKDAVSLHSASTDADSPMERDHATAL